MQSPGGALFRVAILHTHAQELTKSIVTIDKAIRCQLEDKVIYSNLLENNEYL